jgi:hypothetical protein
VFFSLKKELIRMIVISSRAFLQFTDHAKLLQLNEMPDIKLYMSYYHLKSLILETLLKVMPRLRIFLSTILSITITCCAAQNRCGTSSLGFRDLLSRFPSSQLPRNPVIDRSATGNVLVIPVVVHVLYNNAAQNISDEQIKSQIDVLNEDYSGTNGTAAEVPASWKGMVGDSKIRFALAQRTPDAVPQNTNGIIRKHTDYPSYQFNDVSIKYTVTGGSDAWPRDEYLNIWVCNLENGVLGFASFPGGAADEDGIVVHYEAFGRVGDLKSKYNFGRSATHEIGHWFSLIHIWGDTPDCTLDDQVNDTPLQADADLCCPEYPQYDGCTTSGDGIMFMNYMDYTDDKFMQFFTPGQIARMDTAIMDYRSSISSSQGVVEAVTHTVDLSVEEVMDPVKESQNRCFVSRVKVKNKGTTTVNGFTLRYGIYEGNQKNFFVDDSITPGAELIISLPELSGKDGQNILEVRIVQSDENTVNNYISRGFYSKKENTAGCEDSDPLIFPNPVTGTSFCVKSNFSKSQTLKIRLVNLLGQKLYEVETGSNPGDMFSVPAVNLTPGVYFIQLVGEDESRSASFLYFPSGSEGVPGSCE